MYVISQNCIEKPNRCYRFVLKGSDRFIMVSDMYSDWHMSEKSMEQYSAFPRDYKIPASFAMEKKWD